MFFYNSHAKLIVPDGRRPRTALADVTHLGVGAHPDDVEFMAWRGILNRFDDRDNCRFASIVVTSGGGSSRTGNYANFSDEEMTAVRSQELQKAAHLGDYAFLASLGYTSAQVRGSERSYLVNDLQSLLLECRPQVIYTHNLADRHDTHVAVGVSLIEALRAIADQYRPQEFYGCEVWRSLDWLTGEDRRCFDVGSHPALSSALTGLFDSQIAGGKRYDLAALGRRQANATYNDAYHADNAALLELAMDLTPLLEDVHLSLSDYLSSLIENFRCDCVKRLSAFES